MNTYNPPADRIVHYTYADFTGRLVPRPVHLVQYDNSLPIVAVTLYNDGQPYVLPSNSGANIRWHKKDNNIVYNPALGCDAARGVVYFEITQQMTVLEGVTEPVVEIVVNNTQVASSGSFKVIIDRNPVTKEELASSSEAKAIYEYVQMAEEAAMHSSESALSSSGSEVRAATSANAAYASEVNSKASENAAKTSETNALNSAQSAAISENNASTSEANAIVAETGAIAAQNRADDFSDESEAWAVGTKDGVPVDSTAEQYENNSKYWAEQAREYVVDIATTEKAGIVKPDGDTITVDPDGTIHGATSLPEGVISNQFFANKMKELDKAIEENPGGGGGTPLPEDVISNANFSDRMDDLKTAIAAGTGVNVAEEVKAKLGNEPINMGDGTASRAINTLNNMVLAEYGGNETKTLQDWLEYIIGDKDLKPDHRRTKTYCFYTSGGWFNIMMSCNADNYTGIALAIHSDYFYIFRKAGNSAIVIRPFNNVENLKRYHVDVYPTIESLIEKIIQDIATPINEGRLVSGVCEWQGRSFVNYTLSVNNVGSEYLWVVGTVVTSGDMYRITKTQTAVSPVITRIG